MKVLSFCQGCGMAVAERVKPTKTTNQLLLTVNSFSDNLCVPGFRRLGRLFEVENEWTRCCSSGHLRCNLQARPTPLEDTFWFWAGRGLSWWWACLSSSRHTDVRSVACSFSHWVQLHLNASPWRLQVALHSELDTTD